MQYLPIFKQIEEQKISMELPEQFALMLDG